MRKNNGLKALINLLDSTDPDVKKQTAYAISIILDDCMLTAIISLFFSERG